MKAHESIKIHAPIELVWNILSDIDRWPYWQTSVSEAAINGSLTEGSTFRWKAAGMKLESSLKEVVEPHRIAWSGRSLGSQAIHHWELVEQDGVTTVTTTETMSGWLVSAVGFFKKTFLRDALREVLEELKSYAEGKTNA